MLQSFKINNINKLSGTCDFGRKAYVLFSVCGNTKPGILFIQKKKKTREKKSVLVVLIANISSLPLLAAPECICVPTSQICSL